MTPRVLAFARPDDPCVDLVARALSRRGAALVAPDLAAFPGEALLSLSVGPDATPPSLGGVALDDACAAWIRHLDVAERLPEGLAPEHRTACQSLAFAALSSLLECLDLPAVDPPDVLQRAPLKARQGQLAQRLGLSVPRTLVSNDPDAIRAFAARCGGDLIAKMVEGSTVMVQGARGLEAYPTFALSAEDLDTLPGIELSPMIVPERIPKAREARVTLVGEELFVAAVEVGDVIDVRTDPSLIAGLRPYPDLPAPVLAALGALADHVGLNFATFDLIQTPDDRWVFLEMNTVSFFDHVERNARLPISDALAELLLGQRPRRGVAGRAAP